MFNIPKIINKTLSVRLSLMVVLAMTLLLMSSLVFMLHYSRKAVKEEALQKASQTLDGTIARIDNILLSTEQTAGNFYFMMRHQLNDSNKIYAFSRELVESNPYISGCAIAFEPGFYEGCDEFMAYYHRSEEEESKIIKSRTFGTTSYTQQLWYTHTMKTGKSQWINPMTDVEGVTEPIVTFSLPIWNSKRETIGVMGIDVSLELLSHIVLEAKPSPNSYCTMLDGDGQYIVHPDSNKLFRQAIFSQKEYESDENLREAAKAMLAGESGYRSFKLNNINHFIFYKPFVRTSVKVRSMEALHWYIGIIYPEDDIFGDYDSLLTYVLAIALIGLLLIFILCRFIIHRQLLPLRMLTESAQRIAEGKFNEQIPEGHHHHDEIGRLQDNFQRMQQSLASNIGELEQLKANIQERGEELKKVYNEVKKADRIKTAFLHNMTNQMISPAESIDKDVIKLCDHDTSSEETAQLAEDIQQSGNTITKLLNDLIRMSEEEMRKEGAHD